MSKNFFINLDNLKNTSRFSISKFLEFTDNFDPINSNFLLELSKLKSGGNYTVKGEDARPDLISNEIYGSTEYWWIIMYYNGLVRVDDLKNGSVLAFPKIDDLDELYLTLKARELRR